MNAVTDAKHLRPKFLEHFRNASPDVQNSFVDLPNALKVVDANAGE